MNQEILGDCLEIMPTLKDKSIDLILCDLPYGSTACHWDSIIPFEPLWAQYKRLIKDNGAIVLTASQPFTSALVMSNPKMFKYCWVWQKSRKTGFQMARIRPMKEHEDIAVFYNAQPTYNQTLTRLEKPVSSWRKNGKGGNLLNVVKTAKGRMQEWTGFNSTIIPFSNEHNVGAHPTQKPVALFEYLIRTYTNESDTVLDNCAGSFTTAIAALNTNRNYICIEKDEKYYEIGTKRIREHLDKKATELQF
jgi:site-specific DNA-methyltransferase (adenine-specific)